MTPTATKKAPAKKAAAKPEPANRLVSRKYGATGHGYLLDGEKIAGVTTILNALPKQLKQWAADCSANYAVEHWDDLSKKPMTKKLDEIRYAHRDVVGEAALRGNQIHGFGERLVKGLEVDIPEEYLGPSQAYARFLDEWAIEPLATEAAIVNTRYRYGGRGDLWGDIGKRDGALAYIDLKTGTNVYQSVVLQSVAYDNADLWQPDGPDSEQPYEQVDLIYGAHSLPDSVRMLPVRGAGGARRPGPSTTTGRSSDGAAGQPVASDRPGFEGRAVSALVGAGAPPGSEGRRPLMPNHGDPVRVGRARLSSAFARAPR
jgi:hypothetical protein